MEIFIIRQFSLNFFYTNIINLFSFNDMSLIIQVHSEFKRQFTELTVDKLLEQFVLTKYTGFEKPGKL